MEGDSSKWGGKKPANLFLSTPSGWRATSRLSGRLWRLSHFYPRPPGGGRPQADDRADQVGEFLSTPSGWRATDFRDAGHLVIAISIHALRVEGDSKNGQSFRLLLRKREKNLPL